MRNVTQIVNCDVVICVRSHRFCAERDNINDICLCRLTYIWSWQERGEFHKRTNVFVSYFKCKIQELNNYRLNKNKQSLKFIESKTIFTECVLMLFIFFLNTKHVTLFHYKWNSCSHLIVHLNYDDYSPYMSVVVPFYLHIYVTIRYTITA